MWAHFLIFGFTNKVPQNLWFFHQNHSSSWTEEDTANLKLFFKFLEHASPLLNSKKIFWQIKAKENAFEKSSSWYKSEKFLFTQATKNAKILRIFFQQVHSKCLVYTSEYRKFQICSKNCPILLGLSYIHFSWQKVGFSHQAARLLLWFLACRKSPVASKVTVLVQLHVKLHFLS